MFWLRSRSPSSEAEGGREHLTLFFLDVFLMCSDETRSKLPELDRRATVFRTEEQTTGATG